MHRQTVGRVIRNTDSTLKRATGHGLPHWGKWILDNFGPRYTRSVLRELELPNDPYRVMGLHPGADIDVIKVAYRKLAQKHHPDNRETGNTERFKQIQEAYEQIMKERQDQ